MPTAEQIQAAIRKVTDQRSFIDVMLKGTLNWPIHLDFDPDIEDITYEWNDKDLDAEGLTRDVLSGPVLQMQSMEQEHEQPWGIFILEFANETPFVTGQGLAGPLRKVLRGLVPKRRQRQANLKAWDREDLLFICTHQYRHFRFAYFKAPKEKGRAEPLTTFGWEPGIPVRTVCEFNLGCLEWPQDSSDGATWLKQWACAFNKEPLTREFFKRFDKVLERMKADLEEHQRLPSTEAYSRSQLLLERMIFAYFLQNRGWLNRQRDYLAAAFEPHSDKPDKFTFYEEALEPLFWTLASAPNSPSRFTGVPFLNGGLFDDDEFEPSVKRKKNNPPLRIRNSTFGFAFSHLLDAFNFTVREDTPLDQDVAVDPEMLGKVFESIVLHAEAQAEYNAPDKRKATGSYYTPRIVVHFICREALRLYLKGQLAGPEWDARIKLLFEIDPTDGIKPEEMKALKGVFRAQDGRALLNILRNIKTCDPAVGSGAFPVGLLHELVNLRRIAETVANGFIDSARREGSNWIHETKADIVENCLYGVDIQQQAIEICRLRLWLSLIVDYDLGLDPFKADPAQFEDAIRKISQLPNLEMNFRRGDSLLDMICDVNVRIECSQRYRKEYEHIRKLSRDLHNARKGERKRKLRVDILQRRLELTEKVLSDEIEQLQKKDSVLAGTWFGETESESQQRRQIAEEIEHLQNAVLKVGQDRRTLEKIAAQPYDSCFYPKLRKLEGAEFDAPFNFAWRLDFADIFQRDGDNTRAEGGFDLILGNPPFVTARNPEKRELYRERWKRVCSGKYLLVCPFFDLSFGLLRPGGQLGFIVSNAFAKREFGKPLVEGFFPTISLQKVVDCSGLMFPGHGTPTCIIFGMQCPPDDQTPIRIAAILPGGGDLRTPPEESPLWQTLSEKHDSPGYADNRVVVADRARKSMGTHPWAFDSSTSTTADVLNQAGRLPLLDFLGDEIGVCTMTNADPLFIIPSYCARQNRVPRVFLHCFQEGEDVKNWTLRADSLILVPYGSETEILPEVALGSQVLNYLRPFRKALEDRISFGNRTFKELGRAWYSFERMNANKYRTPRFITFAEMASHGHFVFWAERRIFERDSPVIKMPSQATDPDHHLLCGVLNSSAVLFWLKQVCFNKGAGEEEQRDRFVYGGSKVQQLPVPAVLADALRGKRNALTGQLVALSRACWEHGRHVSAFATRRLFEKPGEAYHEWNSSLSCYRAPDPTIGLPFQSEAELRASFGRLSDIRETLRAEMISLQEEMDWLVYEAYGLIPADCPAVPSVDVVERLPPVERQQRPFSFWEQTEGDFSLACSLIPSDWGEDRKALWRARLECIRDNEHVRRIEQPAYKRRWDEQWKVGNCWQCGPVAYDAELVDAFDWWLSEKAEWWLEHEAKGGPVALDTWTAAMWKDSRVQAAWPVVHEAMDRLGKSDTFERYFRNLVKSQSVPDNIPWAVPWDELEKKMSVPASAKRIRGKLNVPRERFRLTPEKAYVWAGLKMFHSE